MFVSHSAIHRTSLKHRYLLEEREKSISIPLFYTINTLKILPLNVVYTGFFSLSSPNSVNVNNFVALLVSTVKSIPTSIVFFSDAFHMFSQTSPKSRRTRIALKTDVKCFKYSLKWKEWLSKSKVAY